MGTTQPQLHPLSLYGRPLEALQKATTWVQAQKDDVLEKSLERTYKLVQEKKVKIPEAIRELADKFYVIAQDPEKSKIFAYDAARAARSLYSLAQKYENPQSNSPAPSPDIYDDPTTPMRRSSEGNIAY